MSVDSRYHRRGIGGRVRDAKSTADTESGSERSAEKNRRVDRPVERAGRNLSGNLEKWRHLRNPDQGFGQVQTYRGTATRAGISFERNGKAETIRSGKGERTGMKWLADKKDCLVIRRILPGLIGSLQLI
jgi:hypothetical protein